MVISLNFFAGAGAGKSTCASATFAKLKYMDINCELVQEYAKDCVWNESFHTLTNQIYVFGKQHHRMFRLKDKVDIIVTDSPLLLTLIYGTDLTPSFTNLVLEEFHKFDNLNILLKRVKRYQPIGRMQTEDEARQVDKDVEGLLNKHSIPYVEVVASSTAPETIFNMALNKMAAANQSE